MNHSKIIYLLRHGEVEDRYKKRFRGSLDCGLSESGQQMSEKNAEFLAAQKVGVVLTTGLKRSDQVGHLLKAKGIKHEVHRGFREAEFGQWEGKSWAEVQSEFPEFVKMYEDDPAHLRFPNGESMAEIKTRVLKSWQEILVRPENKIAIVGHSTTNTLLLSHLKGKGFRELGLQTIGSFHEIHSDGTNIQIIRENVVIYE